MRSRISYAITVRRTLTAGCCILVLSSLSMSLPSIFHPSVLATTVLASHGRGRSSHITRCCRSMPISLVTSVLLLARIDTCPCSAHPCTLSPLDHTSHQSQCIYIYIYMCVVNAAYADLPCRHTSWLSTHYTPHNVRYMQTASLDSIFIDAG